MQPLPCNPLRSRLPAHTSHLLGRLPAHTSHLHGPLLSHILAQLGPRAQEMRYVCSAAVARPPSLQMRLWPARQRRRAGRRVRLQPTAHGDACLALSALPLGGSLDVGLGPFHALRRLLHPTIKFNPLSQQKVARPLAACRLYSKSAFRIARGARGDVRWGGSRLRLEVRQHVRNQLLLLVVDSACSASTRRIRTAARARHTRPNVRAAVEVARGGSTTQSDRSRVGCDRGLTVSVNGLHAVLSQRHLPFRHNPSGPGVHDPQRQFKISIAPQPCTEKQPTQTRHSRRRRTGEEKKGASVIFDSTKVHSVTPAPPREHPALSPLAATTQHTPASAHQPLVPRTVHSPPTKARSASSPPAQRALSLSISSLVDASRRCQLWTTVSQVDAYMHARHIIQHRSHSPYRKAGTGLTLVAGEGGHDAISELRAGVSHREGGGAAAGLGLHDNTRLTPRLLCQTRTTGEAHNGRLWFTP